MIRTLTAHYYADAGPTDFCYTVEGELVVYFDVGCRSAECRCWTSLAGLNSGGATTTAKVTEVPVTRDDAVQAVAGFLERTGLIDADDITDMATELVDEAIDIAAEFPVGTVIEVDGYERGQLEYRDVAERATDGPLR